MASVISFSFLLLAASGMARGQEAGKFFFKPSTTYVPFTTLLCTSAAFNGFADAWLITSTIPCMAQLQLPQRRKIALMVVMSAGILVIITGITLVVYIAETAQKPVYGWNALLFGIWTAAELCVGLFCTWVPATLPPLRKLAPRAMASLTGDTSLSNAYGNRALTLRMRVRRG
jgi:hypothetical protein